MRMPRNVGQVRLFDDRFCEGFRKPAAEYAAPSLKQPAFEPFTATDGCSAASFDHLVGDRE
jgi:hypothetical protein